MTVYEVLKCLHRSSLFEIVEMLNDAIYGELHVKVQFVIHTGYSFSIQTGTRFELFYDYENHKLIYQSNKIGNSPCTLGLIVSSKGGRFYDVYKTQAIINGFSTDDNSCTFLPTTENNIYHKKHTHSFEIFDDKENIIDSFPLSGSMKNSIFYFGSIFKVEDDF